MDDNFEDQIQQAMEVAQPPPDSPLPNKPMIDRHLDHVRSILERLNANARQLEAEIAERTDQLRQTRVSIEAFRLAKERLRP